MFCCKMCKIITSKNSTSQSNDLSGKQIHNCLFYSSGKDNSSMQYLQCDN